MWSIFFRSHTYPSKAKQIRDAKKQTKKNGMEKKQQSTSIVLAVFVCFCFKGLLTTDYLLPAIKDAWIPWCRCHYHCCRQLSDLRFAVLLLPSPLLTSLRDIQKLLLLFVLYWVKTGSLSVLFSFLWYQSQRPFPKTTNKKLYFMLLLNIQHLQILRGCVENSKAQKKSKTQRNINNGNSNRAVKLPANKPTIQLVNKGYNKLEWAAFLDSYQNIEAKWNSSIRNRICSRIYKLNRNMLHSDLSCVIVHMFYARQKISSQPQDRPCYHRTTTTVNNRS